MIYRWLFRILSKQSPVAWRSTGELQTEDSDQQEKCARCEFDSLGARSTPENEARPSGSEFGVLAQVVHSFLLPSTDMHCRSAQRVGSKSLASINSRFGHSLAGSQRGSTHRPPNIRREPPNATPEFGEQLKKLTNAFIQNASRTEGSGWKSNPDVPKINHLRALVRTPKQPRAPSAEKETFFATGDETAEEDISVASAASIPPSSFVEIRRCECRHVIYSGI